MTEFLPSTVFVWEAKSKAKTRPAHLVLCSSPWLWHQRPSRHLTKSDEGLPRLSKSWKSVAEVTPGVERQESHRRWETGFLCFTDVYSCPRKCGGVSWVSLPCIALRHFCLERSWTTAWGHKLVCWCVQRVQLFYLPSHLVFRPLCRHGGAQWLTHDLLQQFSTRRIPRGHQRLSSSPQVPWRVASTHSIQEASPHNSLQQWAREVQDSHFITHSLWWIWARPSATNTTCRGTGYMNGFLAWVCSSVIEEQQVWSHHLWF